MGDDNLRFPAGDLEARAEIGPAISEEMALARQYWELAEQPFSGKSPRMEHSIGERVTELVLDRLGLIVRELLQSNDVRFGIVVVVHQPIGGRETVPNVVAQDTSGNTVCMRS